MQSSGLKKCQGTVKSRGKAQDLTSGLELQAWCFPFPNTAEGELGLSFSFCKPPTLLSSN